MNKSRTAILT